MKKLILLALVAIFHVDHFSAQNDTAAIHYAASITTEELKDFLYELSSDKYEGRETGQPGQKKAAAFIADYYQSLGLPPVVNGSYFQQYPLKKESLAASTFEVDGKTFNFISDFYCFPGIASGEIDAGEIVFIGYGIEDPKYSDYRNVDVEEKMLMCFTGEPVDNKGNSWITGTSALSDWSGDFGFKIELARSKGARGILFINPEFKSFVPRIRFWLENPGLSLDYPSGTEAEKLLPFLFISPDLADFILSRGKMKSSSSLKKSIDKKGKPLSRNFSAPAKIHVKHSIEKIQAENVLGFIEGVDPLLKNEVVVISAHYDHIGIVNGEINNGADDDGSGTVSALEIAEAFAEAKRNGAGPRRSVLILNVSGEEKGLLGSEWYSEYPVYPLENTVCDLNIDMIGRFDEQHSTNANYVYLIGSDRLSTDLHMISEECNTRYTGLQLDYTYNQPSDPNRFYYRSDHYNFAKHGIPVIFYFSGVHEDYHKPGDDPEKILYDKMTTIARLVFHTAWEVANRNDRLKVDVENEFVPD